MRSAFPGIRIVAFGHMGDGNIHYNASMPDAAGNATFIAKDEPEVNRIVYEVVARLNGSLQLLEPTAPRGHRLASDCTAICRAI